MLVNWKIDFLRFKKNEKKKPHSHYKTAKRQPNANLPQYRRQEYIYEDEKYFTDTQQNEHRNDI